MVGNNHELDVEQLPVVQFTDRETEIIEHVTALRNITYDPISGGQVHGNQSSRSAHRTGTIGEAAVAKFLNALNIYDLNAMVSRGDGGKDFQVDGKSIDVKSTQTDMTWPDLIVPEDPKPSADLYILVHVIDDSTARLVGSASKDIVLNHPVRRAPSSRRNYWIPPNDLTLFTGSSI